MSKFFFLYSHKKGRNPISAKLARMLIVSTVVNMSVLSMEEKESYLIAFRYRYLQCFDQPLVFICKKPANERESHIPCCRLTSPISTLSTTTLSSSQVALSSGPKKWPNGNQMSIFYIVSKCERKNNKKCNVKANN